MAEDFMVLEVDGIFYVKDVVTGEISEPIGFEEEAAERAEHLSEERRIRQARKS